MDGASGCPGGRDAQYNPGQAATWDRVPQDDAGWQQRSEKAAAQAWRRRSTNSGSGTPGHGCCRREKARLWMEQAAAQGDTQAQVNLGMLYYQGRGVPGLREGSTALREAAAQGV